MNSISVLILSLLLIDAMFISVEAGHRYGGHGGGHGGGYGKYINI